MKYMLWWLSVAALVFLQSKKRLMETMQRDSLNLNLNGDEAAALGAGFYAAGLSPSFQVCVKLSVEDIFLSSDCDGRLEEPTPNQLSHLLLLRCSQQHQDATQKGVDFQSQRGFLHGHQGF